MCKTRIDVIGALVVCVAGSSAVASIPWLYFADLSGIDQVRSDGVGFNNVLTGSTPIELRVDEIGGRVFFVSGSSAFNWLRSTSVTGGAVTDIFQSNNAYINIAYDSNLDRVYGGDPGVDKIIGVNPNGTGFSSVLTTPNSNGFEVDIATGQIYYTERFGARIGRVESNGSGNATILQTSLTPGMVDAWTIDLDPTANQMYFAGVLTSDNTYHLQRANMDGTGGFVDLLTLNGVPRALRIDIANGKLYWSEGNLIRRSNLDGTAYETVYTHTSTIYGLDVTTVPSPGGAVLIAGMVFGVRRRRG